MEKSHQVTWTFKHGDNIDTNNNNNNNNNIVLIASVELQSTSEETGIKRLFGTTRRIDQKM